MLSATAIEHCTVPGTRRQAYRSMMSPGRLHMVESPELGESRRGAVLVLIPEFHDLIGRVPLNRHEAASLVRLLMEAIL